MDTSPPSIEVRVDEFAVTARDQWLVARLAGSFALCLSDEVQEAGALLHMRCGRPGRVNDPELTDNTLSTDLLLFDRCLAELKRADPRARHWQARFIAHVDPAAGGHERLDGIRAFIAAYLADVGVTLVASSTCEGPAHRVRFRPSLAQLRSEPAE